MPWIEPKEDINTRDVKFTQDELDRMRKAAEDQRKDLERWFAAGTWELEQPKILETSQGKLLFNEYRNLADGVVELKPCSIVFLSQQLKNDSEVQKRRAFVLRAPQGALLKFDGPMDTKSLQLGKLVGGEVKLLVGRLPGLTLGRFTLTNPVVHFSQDQIAGRKYESGPDESADANAAKSQ